MGEFVVEGGHALSGKVRVQGAKNAALPILAASVISEGPILLENCPDITDVHNMLGILSELGISCSMRGNRVEIDPSKANSAVMPESLSKKLRSSIFMLGPLLSRFGRAVCTYPGGCEIGHRPVDLHLRGLAALGADIGEERGCIVCTGKNMHGADIHLDYPSVGATENIIMAAVTAKGDTCITNAAREPEIEDLQRFLNALGCSVCGAGTSTVYIKGGINPGGSVRHTVMPDRIAAGTLLCAVAAAGGEVELTSVSAEHLGSMIAKLREAGCSIFQQEDRLTIACHGRPQEIKLIETLPYPGFPTDMQAQFFALCTMARGTSVIVENVFENRFRHGAELAKMGASVTIKDRTAIIRGAEKLSGASVFAHDLRCGAALVIAALGAEGITTVHNTQFIDRGYERLEETLNSLGARIARNGG